MASGPITLWQIGGETMEQTLQMVTAAMKKTLAPWKKSYGQPQQRIKKQRYYFTDKGPYSRSFGFSNSHVWM